MDTRNKQAMGGLRLDLLIKDEKARLYVIEFEATASVDEMKNHLEKALKYKNLLSAEEAWLVHIGIAQPEESYQYQTHKGVNSIYIWHDKEFKNSKVWVYKESKLIKEEKIES